MTELNNTLDRLGWFQMVLALGFVASYAMALTPFAGPRGQQRSALVALLCGIGFSAITEPWTHGVLLVLMAVAGMAVFVGTAWLLSRLAGTAEDAGSAMPASAGTDAIDRRAEPPMHGGAASNAH